MNSTHTPDPPDRPKPGRLSRALMRMMMKHARITAIEPLAPTFRLLTLESPEFKGHQWVPGQKLQVAMGSAFVTRTFTPIDWDPLTGHTRILGYVHGSGPASAWISAARQGDECDVFGPRSSLDLSPVGGKRVLILGDETSIGLAHAVSRIAGTRPSILLEVNEAGSAREVLVRLGIDQAEVFERTANDSHLDTMERRLPALAEAGVTCVLTGKASSIQRLRRGLKALGGSAVAQLLTKPYWAVGKSGLD